MGLNTHERFENHMDVSSPDTIGDAEKIEDLQEDNNVDDAFDKRLSDAESMKEQHFEIVAEEDVTIPKREENSLFHDKTIPLDSSHMTPDSVNDDLNTVREISGFRKTSDKFQFNTRSTLEEKTTHMSDNDKEYFDKQLDAGGGVYGQNGHLRGAGREYFLTSDSSKKASGSFVTDINPGKEPKEIQENLQLPYGNNAEVVDKVTATKAHVAFVSKVAPQKDFAEKSGYKAREGIEQVFIPTFNKKGPLEAGILEVKENVSNNSENEKTEDAFDGTITEVTLEEQQTFKDKLGWSDEKTNKCTIDENGVIHYKTDRSDLEGKTSENGVPYDRRTIEINGVKIEGVFPIFDSAFDTELSPDNLKTKIYAKECNAKLKEAVKNDPELRSKFINEQLKDIGEGRTPTGYVWHHNEEPGKMQLVKREDHDKTIGGAAHTGGNSLWGADSVDKKGETF